MKLYPYATHSHDSGTLPARNILLGRLMATLLSLGCTLAVTFTAYSTSVNAIPSSSTDDRISSLEIASQFTGLAAQIVIDDPGFRIDNEAFNKHREQQIAEDSRKLLSLAIEVRAELAQTPGDSLPLDTVRKIKEIEKLARSVKEKMQIDPGEN